MAWTRWLSAGILGLAVCLALGVNLSTVSSKGDYVRRYARDREAVGQVNEILDSIPKEASVQASTFYVPRISMRDVVYRIEGDKLLKFDTDYAVIDLRPGVEDEPQQQVQAYEEAGYELTEYMEDKIAVLKKG